MKSMRKSPFMDTFYTLLITIAALLSLASFVNLKEKSEEEPQVISEQKSFLDVTKLSPFFSKMRFGFIMFIFFILFLEDEE